MAVKMPAKMPAKLPAKMQANMPQNPQDNDCRNACKNANKNAQNIDNCYAFMASLGEGTSLDLVLKERRSPKKNQVKIRCVFKCVLAPETSPA